MRQIWIIPKSKEVIESDIKDAKLQGCSEIVNGIPPILVNSINEDKLPRKYEEPEMPIFPSRDLAKEVDELKEKVAKLEETLAIKNP